MDIYLQVDRIGTKIDEFEKGIEDCQIVEINASENMPAPSDEKMFVI